MSRKYRWLRHPRTTAERRANQDEYDGSTNQGTWCRGRRRGKNLTSAWDDKPHGCQKSWKEFRKTQYHACGRGEKHTIFIYNTIVSIWKLEEYFREHNIPYHTECIRKPYKTQKKPVKKYFVVGQKPLYHYKYTVTKDENGKRIYTKVKKLLCYTNVYDYEFVGYKNVTYYHTLGYEFSWWSNKDVGIEFILSKATESTWG